MKEGKKLMGVESQFNIETNLKYFSPKHLNGQKENKLELLFITFLVAFNSWGILRNVHIQMFLSWGDGYKFGEKTPPDFSPRVTNSLKLTARFAPEKLDAWTSKFSGEDVKPCEIARGRVSSWITNLKMFFVVELVLSVSVTGSPPAMDLGHLSVETNHRSDPRYLLLVTTRTMCQEFDQRR